MTQQFLLMDSIIHTVEKQNISSFGYTDSNH